MCHRSGPSARKRGDAGGLWVVLGRGHVGRGQALLGGRMHAHLPGVKQKPARRWARSPTGLVGWQRWAQAPPRAGAERPQHQVSGGLAHRGLAGHFSVTLGEGPRTHMATWSADAPMGAG